MDLVITIVFFILTALLLWWNVTRFMLFYLPEVENKSPEVIGVVMGAVTMLVTLFATPLAILTIIVLTVWDLFYNKPKTNEDDDD